MWVFKERIVPELDLLYGSMVKARAEHERITVHSISRRWINHSLAEKLWKKGLAFLSISCTAVEKNCSSFPKALIVVAPEIASPILLVTVDLVVPLIRISSFAEA